MSLRARLLALVLLATLLPALLMGWRFLRGSDGEVQAATRTLATTADELAAELGQRVQGTAQLLFGLTQARALGDGDQAACSAFLSAVREAYPQYTGLLTVRPDGELFCDSLRTGRRLNVSDRPYFRRAANSLGGVVIEPAIGRLTGTPVLQIVHAARSDTGSLRFMVVASLNLQKFAQGAAHPGLDARPRLLLVDDAGMVLVGDGEEGRTAGRSIAGTALFALATARGGGGVGELQDDQGRTEVWAVAGHPAAHQAGLHILLGLPRQDLVAQTRQRLRQDLQTLAATAVLLFIGVWLLAEWGIRRQVVRITDMVRRLGEGDLGARIELPYPRGELGGLMAALNSTAASLQRQRLAIDELGRQLRQAHKLEAIGTLAGGIAHDFNNVLGAILGNLSLAQEEALAGQPTQHSLAQIRRAALRARDLVQRIRAFSRADTATLAPLELRPVVEEVLSLAQVGLPPGVTLRTELQDAPLLVMGDATQLHQVVLNLCTNAWQALQGRVGEVTVRLRADGGQAHLSVSDTGCGITAADRERIFEPFFTTKGSTGTGLGLSVAYGIVGAHHGVITVDSSPVQGSRFDVRLPLLADGRLAADTAAAQAAEPRPARGNGQHVMYIDDDEVMALMVERLLGREGYRVSSYLGAQAALQALRADPQGVDLVVTDFNMPELSGLEVGHAVAALRPDLPVLMISGYVFDELPAQARRAGAREVIRKQHVLEELVPAIARALSRPAD